MTGPGLWIRIRRRFGPRLSEWMFSAITIGWGLIMLWPGDTFELAAYAGFKALFGSDTNVGALMFVLGLARLGGLIVNGARKDVTPWIRLVSAFIGAMVWVGCGFAQSLAGVLGVWAVFYPAFAVWELINMHRAATDAGESYAGNP